MAAFPGPTWSAYPGANGKIAFASRVSTYNHHVHTVNPDGSGRSVLVSEAVSNTQPSWSPDGNRLAYSRYTSLSNVDIWLINADGSGKRNLTQTPQPNSADQPTWSPNGLTVAFTSDRRGGAADWVQIWKINADGTGLAQLTTLGNTDSMPNSPAWSPDGSRIAFVVARIWHSDEVGDIWVMGADGSNAHPLGVRGTTPDWSPDGTRLAFTSYRDGNAEIYVMNADGSQQTRLTVRPQHNDRDPAWSPDGTAIVFTSGAVGSSASQLWVMFANGSGIRQLTTGGTRGRDYHPSWQPR